MKAAAVLLLRVLVVMRDLDPAAVTTSPINVKIDWHIDSKSLGIEGKGLRWEFLNKKENKKRRFRQGKISRK